MNGEMDVLWLTHTQPLHNMLWKSVCRQGKGGWGGCGAGRSMADSRQQTADSRHQASGITGPIMTSSLLSKMGRAEYVLLCSVL